MKNKKIKINVSMNINIEVPEEWDKTMIEFWANEGTWCASNIIRNIIKFKKENGCLCDCTKITYIEEIK